MMCLIEVSVPSYSVNSITCNSFSWSKHTNYINCVKYRDIYRMVIFFQVIGDSSFFLVMHTPIVHCCQLNSILYLVYLPFLRSLFVVFKSLIFNISSVVMYIPYI